MAACLEEKNKSITPTIIHIFLTGLERENKVITISALQRGTLIHFPLTVESSVACGTLARVHMAIFCLSAFAFMKAGCVRAG